MDNTADQKGRLAIRCLRPDMTDERERDEQEMTEIGVRLKYAVDTTVIELDPDREGPLTTVLLALARTKADAVIVKNLNHIHGVVAAIRYRVPIIVADDEEQLERSEAQPAAAGDRA